MRRTIDYLETRADIDDEKIAYYGLSWGAWLGPIMMAVEERIGSGIILVGGLPPWKLAPAADPINFVRRVKVPVLIISGEFDFLFPIETSARPLLELLGSTDKELKTYDGGHGNLILLFSRQIRGDVLGWLDRYLDPVD
ncbi:alpha/beta hydrolase family protein [Planctomycetota bacterium]